MCERVVCGMQVALTEAVDMVFEMADGREMVLTL